jgi:asparagine synthase (glutamine-hydrolysing)
MCGISGTLTSPGEKQVQSVLLERMNHVHQHRGPDASGLWISPARDVGFGFRRLAIVDLDAKANQPMSNEDDSLHLVFNGEIYNHAEIRSELEAKGGHSWKTDHSDSEVILHAYEEWGVDCLSRFLGMFAFALWDERRRHLWLARDRVGIKPLYYHWNPKFFSFASEIKALLVDPRIHRRMNSCEPSSPNAF